MDMRVVIDVDDMQRAVSFYVNGVGLSVGRRFDAEWVELLGAPVPVDLLTKASGTKANPAAIRQYTRHWTPVHLDFVVADVDAAVAKLLPLGAKLESAPEDKRWGRIAILSDPFGHGICLLQFRGRGYDELL